MEMTIDEAILTIKNAIHFTYDEVYEEAFAMAINTMRKYQKITHIINDVSYLDKDEYKIASIKEIINGNDDR